MGGVTHLDDKRPHYVGIAMCRSCGHGWVATIVQTTNLLKLECSRCGKFKSFFSFLPDNYLESSYSPDGEREFVSKGESEVSED